jgi:hypothetical protein
MAAKPKHRRDEVPVPDEALRVLAQMLAARLAGAGDSFADGASPLSEQEARATTPSRRRSEAGNTAQGGSHRLAATPEPANAPDGPRGESM